MPMLLITTVSLIVQINYLPKKISEALNMPPKDTIVVRVAENLTIKAKMVYFEGRTKKYCRQISKFYEYNPEYPVEYSDGWLTLMESKNGAKYFIWTSSKMDIEEDIAGWFMVPDGKWQYKDKYLQALVPVVRRNSEQFGTN